MMLNKLLDLSGQGFSCGKHWLLSNTYPDSFCIRGGVVVNVRDMVQKWVLFLFCVFSSWFLLKVY